MAKADSFDRACYGVACPHRGSCHRYHAAGHADCDAIRQGTCLRNGEYRDYVSVRELLSRRSMRLWPSAQLIEQCVAWASNGQLSGSGTALHRRT